MLISIGYGWIKKGRKSFREPKAGFKVEAIANELLRIVEIEKTRNLIK